MVTLRAFITVFALLIGPVLKAGEIDWRTDYAAARAEASDKSRPLLIFFATDHCVWCERQKREFRDVDLTGCVLLQGDTWLAEQLGVTTFPQTVVAAPDGKIKDWLCGFVHAEFVRKAVARGRSK